MELSTLTHDVVVKQINLNGNVPMIFFIQASNPKIQESCDLEPEDLRDYIEDVFMENTEEAFLCWNSIRVPLSYKYDLPVMLEDIIELMTEITENESGEMEIFWPSDTFRTDWKISWSDGKLRCDAKWISITGGLERILKGQEVYEGVINQFLAEWQVLIKKVYHSILMLQNNPAEIEGFSDLEKLSKLKLGEPSLSFGELK